MICGRRWPLLAGERAEETVGYGLHLSLSLPRLLALWLRLSSFSQGQQEHLKGAIRFLLLLSFPPLISTGTAWLSIPSHS